MPVFSGGMKIKEVTVGSTSISKIFYGSDLVWQKLLDSRIAGAEAAAMWLTRTLAVEGSSGPLAAVLDEGEEYVNSFSHDKAGVRSRTWAYMGPNSEVKWTQNGRTCIHAKVADGQLVTTSVGDRKETLAYTIPWPGGWHWVMINTHNDWYGYRLSTFVDGVRAETATNGGALKLSENVFVAGSATLTTSGDVAVVAADWDSIVNEEAEVPALRQCIDTNAWAETVTTSGEWREAWPGAEKQMWLTSGGQGGQGGQGGDGGNDEKKGSRGSSGASGADGVCLKLPVSFTSAVITAGSGGAGGSGGDGGRRRSSSSSQNSGSSGSTGSLGEPSLKGEYTSATGSNLVPSAFGITAPRIGVGGAGGSGGSGGDVGKDGSSGSTGGTGGAGGLTVIYQWPKPE